ncbi:uncharacterized protein LOC663271 [Tribolium castaneum]|uniref:Protein takeout-like Protein n=1 Tax=Tribolium castaneum TaxID=7070 RepID=D2A5D3_TRICA|nr:PREDICTED: uncharacterized protein LOC663271 [Tribolium castaneum]EFA05352.1 Protein takeout-like Protein [Tribolium castaneum]|eukprot:XP_974420.1 PREDICTED: uncharacterized protein LOC663271 [Tribolium castaneum]
MSAILLVVLVFGSTFAKTLPPEIIKCRKSDPNLNQCLDKYVMEDVRKLAMGNRDLGISQLEPLLIPEVTLGQASKDTLQQVYKNVKIHGITSATIKNSKVNFTQGSCYWSYDSLTPVVRMEADYKINGKLLIFTLNGEGKCNNTFWDVEGANHFKCERYTKKGKTHLRMTEHVFKFNPKKVIFSYDNIINGNEQLSQQIMKTINENSLTVYADFGAAIEQVMATVWSQNINEVFARVPEEELFLP